MPKRATIRSKKQITLPKDLRKQYRLREEEDPTLNAGDGILLKHGRTSLRGIPEGRIDAEGFEEGLKKLRKGRNP